MTAVDERTDAAVPAPQPGRAPHRLLALLRNSWRQLTSMRTALVLLFLLAVAAIPGSLLPQRGVSPEEVAAYARENPQLAVWLNRVGAFDVYASPWFAAVYLLLFTSLIGCVVPRLAEHLRALRSVPPDAPQRLHRLPQHDVGRAHAGEPAATAAAIAGELRRRRFRTVVREHPGSWTVSAEKGYSKETGNLLFHFALLAILIAVGFGSWYGWHGNRLLVAGPETAFCNSLQQYDESGLGARVAAADLPPFCLELVDFTATFRPDTGQPERFRATVRVDGDGAAPRTAGFSVNDPLRLDGAGVYLLGHGYAPILRYTDRYGQAQTAVTPFLPVDAMLTSEGVAMFPDANVDPRTGARDTDAEVAFEGLYLPTAPSAPPYLRSEFPAEQSPAVMLWAYRGDLGLDAGIPGSVYELDRRQIDRGRLAQVGEPALLRRGEKLTLDDGSFVEFLGTQPWITISVRHDPAQLALLGGAVVGLLGLMLSLTGRRRRVWFRVTPAAEPLPAGHSVVDAGGLPRTDHPGFGDEFAQLVAATGAHRPERNE